MDVSWLITNPSQLAALHRSRAEGFLSQPPPMHALLGRRSREIPCSSRSGSSLLHASEITLSISFSEGFPPSEGPQTLAVPLISCDRLVLVAFGLCFEPSGWSQGAGGACEGDGISRSPPVLSVSLAEITGRGKISVGTC